MSSAARLRKCAKRVPLIVATKKHCGWFISWTPEETRADRCMTGRVRVRCVATASRVKS